MPALLPVAHAQEHNFVVINPSDSPADIVKKAANVVPSARQFNWQRQELTAFIKKENFMQDFLEVRMKLGTVLKKN